MQQSICISGAWPPIVVMSGDGRESNYDEPNAMKAYAIAQGVPESAIYCDGGGYHTYDTMWRVANVMAAQSVAIVTQKYHQYRAVFDAQGVGMSTVGVVSDTGTCDDQAYYDIREWPARVQDAISVWTGAEPGQSRRGYNCKGSFGLYGSYTLTNFSK